MKFLIELLNLDVDQDYSTLSHDELNDLIHDVELELFSLKQSETDATRVKELESQLEQLEDAIIQHRISHSHAVQR